ncbi:MAG TPA: hypothetical protein VEH81_05620 [Ktedonobacteraceae bacterium]|nr:hypothetical protein [Ktedonobacteraceae bacterium]
MRNVYYSTITAKYISLSTLLITRVAFFFIVFGNFLFNGLFEVALPALARNQFLAGACRYGLLLALFGGGSLLGGLFAGGLGRFAHKGILMLSSRFGPAIVFPISAIMMIAASIFGWFQKEVRAL